MSCKRLTSWPKLRSGTPILDEALMATYEPEVALNWYREKKILSPDSPYAAACARNAIYFIDLRYDLSSAKHIKEQFENLVPEENGHYFTDEVDATAERRDVDGKTVFTWNPAYARVIFADSMNRKNPSLQLPVHEPAGEWLVVYELKSAEVGGKAKRIGTGLTPRESTAVPLSKESEECGASELSTWKAALDTPRFEGEADAEYYQRMDQLHWGGLDDHM